MGLVKLSRDLLSDFIPLFVRPERATGKGRSHWRAWYCKPGQGTDLKYKWIAHRCSLIRRTVKPAEATLGLVSAQPCFRSRSGAQLVPLFRDCLITVPLSSNMAAAWLQPRTAMRDPFIFRSVGQGDSFEWKNTVQWKWHGFCLSAHLRHKNITNPVQVWPQRNNILERFH